MESGRKSPLLKVECKARHWSCASKALTIVIRPCGGRVDRMGVDADALDEPHRRRGRQIRIDRSQLPPPKKGEVYWVDLEGLKVRTTEGQLLGTVDHLFATPANDVLVVKGDRERLIPYVMDTFVKSVDLEGGEMVVDWDPEF